MCREVMSRYAEHVQQKGVLLELFVIGQPVATGQAFAARVVIDNLLSNAIRYIEKGAITIHLTDEGVEIIDSGPGIPANEAKHIYDRAFRGATARSSAAGFGFGLNIVQRLCAFNQCTVLLRNGDISGAVAELHFTARSHWRLLIGAVLLAGAGLAWCVGAVDSATTVRTAVDAVFKANATNPKALREAIEQHLGSRLDAVATARVALGPHWRVASDSERERIAASIHRMVLAAFAAELDQVNDAHVEIVAVRENSSPEDTTVKTLVRRASGPPVSIDYRLLRRAGDWKLHDIGIEGVSTLTTYRRSFSTRVRRVGLATFVDELEARGH